MQLQDMTPQRLRIEAMRAGWARVSTQLTADGPVVKWAKLGTRPRQVLYADDADTLPAGQAQAVRARTIAIMAGRCPLCGAHGAHMTREEVAEVDPWRLQLVPAFAQAVASNGIGLQSEAPSFVVLHALDCAAAARWIDRAAGAPLN